jgi:cytochrome c oxidase subunit 4
MSDAHATHAGEEGLKAAPASPSLTTYTVIYLALLGLMAATIVAAHLPLGALNVPVALTIAATKTVLVALFFMHVRYAGKLIWVVTAGALVWLAILLSTYHDYWTRGWTPNRLSAEPVRDGSLEN